MNLFPVVAPFIAIIAWLATWGIAFYIALRFIRAFERGVLAHEQVAEAMARQASSRDPNISRTIP